MKKAAIATASGVAAHIVSAAAEIRAAGLWDNGEIVAVDVTAAAYDLVDAPEPPPEPWVGGAYAIVGGAWVVADQDILAAVRADALMAAQRVAVDRVNAGAGALRRRVITDIPGQEGTYLDKADEAVRWRADPAPDPNRYIYLPAEAAARELSVDALAAEISARADAWRRINAAIEAARQGALKAIAAAPDAAAALAVTPAWPPVA